MNRLASIPTPWLDVAGGAACLLLLAAIHLLVVEPMLATRSQRATLELELAAERLAAQVEARRVAELRSSIDAARAQLASQSLQLQPVGHLNDRLAALTTSASTGRLSVDQLEPGRAVAGERGVQVPIRVAGQGTFADTVAFLHHLHETMPDVAVSAIDLARQPGQTTPSAKFAVALVWHATGSAEGVAR